MAGRYDIKSIRAGDTFQARAIAKLSRIGPPIVVTFAVMQLRRSTGGALIHEWRTDGASPNASIINGNTVMLDPVSHEITRNWPIGKLVYDLKVTLDDIPRFTLLTGQLEVVKPVTQEV